MTRRVAFRQADVARAIRAAAKAGLAIDGLSVRIEPGGAIELLQTKAEADDGEQAFAAWKARRDARHAQGD